MKRISFILALAFSLPSFSSAQSNSNGCIYLDESTFGVEALENGGFATCGVWFMSGSDQRSTVSTFDLAGTAGWAKKFGVVGNDAAYGLVETENNDLVVVGSSPGGPLDIALVRYDASGNNVWQKLLSTNHSTFGTALVESSNGFLVSGYSSPLSTPYEGVIAEVDPNGALLWSKKFTAPLGDLIAYDVVKLKDGFAVCGYTSLTGNSFVVRFDSANAVAWTRRTQDNTGYLFSITAMPDSVGVVVTGTHETVGNIHVFAAALDSGGNELWQTTIGETTHKDYGHEIERTSDGGYIIAGLSSDFNFANEDRRGILIRLDSAGNLMWSRVHGDTLTPVSFESVKELAGGRFVAAGSSLAVFGADGNITLCPDCPNKEYGVEHESLTIAWTAGGFNFQDDVLTEVQPGMTFEDHASVLETHCLATSVENVEANSKLVLFPNPSSQYVTVLFNESGSHRVRLIDALGKVMLDERNVGNSMVIDVSAVPDGLYVIERVGDSQRSRLAISK